MVSLGPEASHLAAPSRLVTKAMSDRLLGTGITLRTLQRWMQGVECTADT
jgi:hypothetical protein